MPIQGQSLTRVAERLPLLVRFPVTSFTPTIRSLVAAADTSDTPSKKQPPKKRGRPANGNTLAKTVQANDSSKNAATERSAVTEKSATSSTAVKGHVRRVKHGSKSGKQRKRTESHSSIWPGLSTRRLRRMGVVEYEANDFTQRTIGFAMISALGLPRDGLSFSLAIASGAGISPPATTHALLIRATVKSAQQNLTGAVFVPDIAIEAFLRLSSGTPPSIEAITTVASLCEEDPVLERRAERAASLLRYILAAKVKVDQSTLRPIFDLFVSSLDLRSANYTLRFFNTVCHDVSPVDRAHWYDRLAYAALLRQANEVTQLILQEKCDLGLPDTPFGKSVALSLDAENGRRDLAESTAHSMERFGVPIEPFARAALIRVAGRKNDIQAVWRHFQAFENDLGGCSVRYTDTLSVPARHGTATVNDYSGMTSRTQLADPTVAVFDALRMCNKGEDAFELVMRLREQYGIRFSKLVYEMVSQACFRSRRLDLAVQFRRLLQAERDEAGSASMQEVAV